jgi:hypothetical protein
MCVHRDLLMYEGRFTGDWSTQSYLPEQFDGFRSRQMRQGDDEGAKYQAVLLCLDYILFEIGRHAWSVVMYCGLSTLH